jgi:uncharacterized damage-inducible protein DinB
MDALQPYRDLLTYARGETERWAAWLPQHPQAAAVVVGSGRLATIRDVVAHIAIVDLRYAQRLLGMQAVAIDTVAGIPLAETFACARRAQRLFDSWLAMVTPAGLDAELTFQTMSAGTITATARAVFTHTMLHGARHWAQVATTLRQHGHAQDWSHDYLLHHRR